MINAHRVAVEGIGFGALAVATLGLLGVDALFEEGIPQQLSPLTPTLPRVSFEEEFVGAHPLEETGVFQVIALRASHIAVFVDGEILPAEPPPPPPPIPPAIIPPLSFVSVPSGGGVARVEWPRCPPGWEWKFDEKKQKWICKPKPKAVDLDYAILPLNGAVEVTAISDGLVETFVDDKGGLIVRLTTDDGTTYFYAKITNAKRGRVKKGDVIGVTVEAATAPKMLRAPGVEKEPEKAPGIYGVLPVRKPTRVPPPKPRTLPKMTARVGIATRPMPPSAGETMLLAFGIVGLAIGIAWLISRPKKRTKKRRKTRSIRR